MDQKKLLYFITREKSHAKLKIMLVSFVEDVKKTLNNSKNDKTSDHRSEQPEP